MPGHIKLELAYATPTEQVLLEMTVEEGTSIEGAIAASGICARFPEDELEHLAVGIWGRLARRDELVSDGDRIELYRPLLMDPRDARRVRAEDLRFKDPRSKD